MMKIARNKKNNVLEIQSNGSRYPLPAREYIENSMKEFSGESKSYPYLSHMTTIMSLSEISRAGKIFATHSFFMNDPDDSVGLMEDIKIYIREVLIENERYVNVILRVDDYLRHRKNPGVYDNFSEVLSDMGFIKNIDEIFDKNQDKIWIFIYIFISCVLSGINVGDDYRECFILSFSAGSKNLKGGFLQNAHAWGLYGDKGRGVALVFEGNIIKKMISHKNNLDKYNIAQREVVYYEQIYVEELCKIVSDLIAENFKKKFNFSDLLVEKSNARIFMLKIVELSAFFKRQYFSGEREVRFVIFPKDNALIKFRKNNNGNVIPYIEIDISDNQKNKYDESVVNWEIFDELILGSSCDESSSKAVSVMIKAYDLGVSVEKTRVRFRG